LPSHWTVHREMFVNSLKISGTKIVRCDTLIYELLFVST
jgi:hypothetical protein